MRWIILACSLALWGCDGGGAEPDAGDGGPSPMDGGAPDGGPSRDAGVDEDASAPDGGPTTPTPRMEVFLDRPIVERANEQLTELTVTCVPRDADGARLPDPGDLVVSVDAPDASEVAPSRFTFPSRGAYVVTCRSESLGLTGTERVEVAFEGIDRDVVRLAAHASVIQRSIDDGVEAARAGDEAAVRAAGVELRAASELELARFAGLQTLVPTFPWPTADEVAAAGLGDGPDDAAWASALAEVADASAAHRAALAELPTSGELGPTDEADLTAAATRLRDAITAMEGLSPSPAATLASMPALDALLGEEVPTGLRDGSAYLATVFETADVAPSGSGLTLVGALVSIAVQEFLSTYSYRAVLKKAATVIRDNVIQMILADLIDELLPPELGAPEIDLACGASCSFLAPGNPWTISGNHWDDPDETRYRVIFIHPNLPGLLADVAGLFSSARSVLDGDHWIQIAKNVHDIIQSVQDIASATYSVTDPSTVVLQPRAVSPGDPDLVDMGAMPTGVNCSSFPRSGTFIPVRTDVGRGPSFMANFTGEGC